jgi:hypothetical protein
MDGADGVRCSAPGTEYNRGGSVRVNNFAITVPKNLIVQFPVVWAPFNELCTAGADKFETTVVGNIVNGQIIAGQISVAQRFGLEGSQGYISAINPDGEQQGHRDHPCEITDFGFRDSLHSEWSNCQDQ